MNQQSLLIFYDASCHLCQATRGMLLDTDAPLAFIDIRDPAIIQSFPQLRGGALGCQMHVIDAAGEVTAGYDALVTIASRISSMQPFVPLLRWRPVRALGQEAYRFIAAHRYSIFGGTPAASTCELSL